MRVSYFISSTGKNLYEGGPHCFPKILRHSISGCGCSRVASGMEAWCRFGAARCGAAPTYYVADREEWSFRPTMHFLYRRRDEEDLTFPPLHTLFFFSAVFQRSLCFFLKLFSQEWQGKSMKNLCNLSNRCREKTYRGFT